MPEVIGQGTYGCVHKPSLKCKNKPRLNYTNKVSKILRNSDAKKELGEYRRVTKADKKRDFYLGKPVACKFDEASDSNLTAIQKCTIGNSVMRDLDRYELLVMEDGGINLLTYTDKMRSWAKSEMSEENCEKFLLEALRLFAGLQMFLENDLIHYDLKPQNIVYNERTNRINFIDFGLMQSIQKSSAQCKRSIFRWAFFHWSYPWENELLNIRNFERVKKNWRSYYDMINNEVQSKSGRYYDHIKNFCPFVFDTRNHSGYSNSWTNYMNNFKKTLEADMFMMSHNEFLAKSLETVDVFGVGMALNNWFHVAKKHLDGKYVPALKIIFDGMVDARLGLRLSAEDALAYYERFLRESGLLDKYDKEIRNHIVIDRGASARVEEPVAVLRVTKPNREFIDADPKPCPDGKEMNPKTGRCINTCKPGYKRNADFNCVKDTVGDCPEGKVRNPVTGRCVMAKVDRTAEPCPEGKVRNPKTGRCIKNKTKRAATN